MEQHVYIVGTSGYTHCNHQHEMFLTDMGHRCSPIVCDTPFLGTFGIIQWSVDVTVLFNLVKAH